MFLCREIFVQLFPNIFFCLAFGIYDMRWYNKILYNICISECGKAVKMGLLRVVFVCTLIVDNLRNITIHVLFNL